MANSLSNCLQIVDRIHDEDRDALLARLQELQATGVDAKQAGAIAAGDTLASIKAERAEFDRLLREQHPDLFKPAERTAGEAAASAVKNVVQGTSDGLDGLMSMFGQKGRLGSGPVFDEESFAKAVPFFKAAAVKYGQAGQDIVDVMRAIIRAFKAKFAGQMTPAEMKATIAGMEPFITRFADDVESGKIKLEYTNEPAPGDASEQSGRNGQAQAQGNAPSVRNGATGPGSLSGQPSADTGQSGARAPGDRGVPGDRAAAPGERSDQQVRGEDGRFLTEDGAAGSPEQTGSSGDSGERNDAHDPGEASTPEVAPLEDRLKQQKAAEGTAVKFGDAANIRATLPLLMPSQHEDVLFAEKRLMKPEGYGVLFTNGTGTGKTFLGLGIIKRMHTAGKKNGLVVVPNDAVMNEWLRSAKDIGLPITPLTGLNDSGKGVAITTYANLANNETLADRDIDFFVADEAHNLMSSSDASVTGGLKAARAVTFHPDSMMDRANMLDRDNVARLKTVNDRIVSLTKDRDNVDTPMDRIPMLQGQIDKLTEERTKREAQHRLVIDRQRELLVARRGLDRPRAVFLSATPFAYEKNTEWAQGYLYDYGKGKSEALAYNEPGPREQFMIRHFGYSMRYNKLTEPDALVDRGLMQRQFNSWLRKEGVLSARMLNVDKDYDRKFVLIDGGIGTRIDEAMTWLREAESGKFREFYDYVAGHFDYLSRSRLLEAIKAKAAIPYIQAQHKLGRKVVVFYDYNEGGGFNPFDFDGNRDRVIEAAVPNPAAPGQTMTVSYTLGEFVDAFEKQFPDLNGKEFAKAMSPLDTLTAAFPNAGVYNGVVAKSGRQQKIDDFNNDAKPEANLLIVQSAANAGWSGHDRSGAAQRVLINLGLPVAPTKAIQQEGRIYRVGQASDAIFRYFNTGTLWEKMAFATKVARRASTAENLAMGEDARGLLQSFLDAFDNSGDYPPSLTEGTGGKALDRNARQALTPFERAKSLYYGRQKKNASTKSQEGVDYFPTPEPVGLKMVEWLHPQPGHELLEPSAGHGAIARWFPESTTRTAIEPSLKLASELALNTDANLVTEDFESHHINNKYDGIAMNPPFGVGGATAIAHVAKAYTHLKEGGRLVAIIPEGPAADAKFDAWLYAQDAKGRSKLPEARLIASIRMPTSTFGRAGTAVATRIVIIDKISDPKVQSTQVNYDLSKNESIADLFDTIDMLDFVRWAGPKQAAVAPAVGTNYEIRDGKLITDAPEVEYTKKDGSKLPGVYINNEADAKKVDQYAFKGKGMPGWFVRMRHVERPSAGQSSEESSTDRPMFDITRPRNDRAAWNEQRIDQMIRYYRGSGMNAYAAWVEPEKFLAATTPKDERARLEADAAPLRKADLAEEDQWIYLDAVPTGEDGAFKLTSHEGRHRMMALRDAGITRVPVAIALRDGATMTEDDLSETYLARQEYNGGKQAAERGFFVGGLVPIDEAHRGDLIDDFGRSNAAVHFDISPIPEPVRADALTRLKSLERRLEAGKITAEEYRLGVQGVIGKLETRNYVQSARDSVDRRRGADWIVAQLRRAVADGRAPFKMREATEFAEWLLAQNPGLADGLGISIKGQGPVAGQYAPAGRVMTLFLNGMNDTTAVHEILHHSERMMPGEVQDGIRKEWQRAWDRAFKNGSPEMRKALQDMLAASLGGDAAMESVKAAFNAGTLDYDQHYQLFSASEFWAVNATRILADRHAATGWVAKARQWLRELVQHVRGFLGLPSDAPVLKALKSVINGDGTFQSKGMLQEGLRKYNAMAPIPTSAQSSITLVGGQNQPSWNAAPKSVMGSRWDRFVYEMQDRQVNLKRVQEALQKVTQITDQVNGYLKEELFHGRVAARVNKFLKRELNPLLVAMKQADIDFPELEAYLWARHAPERNAQVASINPGMPDGGSGLTNQQAADYMAGQDVHDANGDLIIKGMNQANARKLQALAARVDALTQGTRQTLIQYGLETPDTIAAWDATYANYVPLHREDMESVTPIGSGFSTRGSASKRALGSGLKVVDIIANLALQREAAITRGEKNRVGMALYGLAMQNPNPEFWHVGKIPMRRKIDPQTGLVVVVPDHNYMSAENVLSVRLGGKDRGIIFNQHDKRAMATVTALKNLDVEKMGELAEMGSTVTRYFASINTQYNPIFGITNGFRDIIAAPFNLTTTALRNKKFAVMKAIPAAMRAIWKIERGGSAGNWDAIYEGLQMSGGTTGYREIFRVGGDRAKKLQKEIDALHAKAPEKAFRWLLEWLDNYNTAIENATRLAAYKVARENNISIDQSASLAKNLTVNFNRKGKLGREAGVLYAFFNAGVQGTARLAETLTGPVGRKIIAGGIMLGIMQAMLFRMGFDDDEWKDIPEFIRSRNFIIPTGDRGYITVPLPLGLNILPNIGRKMSEWALLDEGRHAQEHFIDLFSALIDTFNPLGSGPLLQQFAPTALDPVAALAQNKDFAGRPIFKEDRDSTKPTPGFTRALDSSTSVSRAGAKGINWATGGTNYTPGLLSPTPDQLDYIFGTITGGVGREISKAYQSIEGAIKGENVPEHRKPLIGRFYGRTDEDTAVSARYWRNLKEMNSLVQEVKGQAKDGINVESMLKANPEVQAWQALEHQADRIQKLRSDRHKIEFSEAMKESDRTAALKEHDTAIIDAMRQYNKSIVDARAGK